VGEGGERGRSGLAVIRMGGLVHGARVAVGAGVVAPHGRRVGGGGPDGDR